MHHDIIFGLEGGDGGGGGAVRFDDGGDERKSQGNGDIIERRVGIFFAVVLFRS